MSYQVLYRTYRPSKFSEVVGQEYIVKTLLNSIKNNKIAHAYLFAGPRGTGKTTIAKLFAKAINCSNFKDESCDKCDNCKAYLDGNHPDIIELDAASNNGVDEIREIIEQVPYAPLVGKYKVYIIDEVHMMTTSAFNALLKTLEEPPAHVIFILATTDPQKVIPTVLSRCQRYNFSKISNFEIKKRTIEVLKQEKIKYEEKAVEEISRMAEGGMRDALSLLEQCLAYNPKELKLSDVENIFGLISTAKEVELFNQIQEKQVSEVIENLRTMYQHGMDTKRLAIDLLEIVKDALIYSDKANENLLSKITTVEAQKILSMTSVETLLMDAKDLQDCISKERQNQNFLVYLELCLVKMASNNSFSTTTTFSKPKVEVVKKTEKKKIEKEVVKEETPVETKKDVDDNFLLSILLDANKDFKISDQIIYNKLDLYQFESDKRKFYQLLIGTELFACNKDAIIVCGNKSQIDSINDLENNKSLYRFINEEFGIDKMIYGIDESQKQDLINRYKQEPIENRNKPVFVEKYVLESNEESDIEDTMSDIFGDKLKVEE